MSSAAITARFGATVRNLRFRLGLSQEQLAERADLHRTYIAGIESGARNITLKSIVRLARALEVSTAELFDRDQPTSSEGFPGKVVDILLVEDNRDDVRLTLEAFQEIKFANRVQVATDGAEALDYLFCTGRHASRQPDDLPSLLLLDLHLPKISGFEVLRRVKRDRRTRKIPVIVLTMSQRNKDIDECRRLGADLYIVKPVNFHNFSQVTPQLPFQWALFDPAIAPL